MSCKQGSEAVTEPAGPLSRISARFSGGPKNSNVEDLGNRDINKGNWNFTSLEKEIALGRSLATEIEKQVKLVSDPEVAEYVSRVGENIACNSDAKFPFTIKVIDSEEINAFVLPGGFLYVNSGLIKTADEESELACYAHEIAHVANRVQLFRTASFRVRFQGDKTASESSLAPGRPMHLRSPDRQALLS